MLCYLFFILTLDFHDPFRHRKNSHSPIPLHDNYTLPSDLHIIVYFDIKFRFTGGSFIGKLIICATGKERKLVRRRMLAGGYERRSLDKAMNRQTFEPRAPQTKTLTKIAWMRYTLQDCLCTSRHFSYTWVIVGVHPLKFELIVQKHHGVKKWDGWICIRWVSRKG